MSFSDSLWDKFDAVCKKVSNGKNFTGAVAKFLQKRSQIEKEYAKQLSKLCKDKAFGNDLELGSLRDSWQVIKDELEKIANKHETVADETNTMFESMTAYLNEAKKNRKSLVATGDKLTAQLKSSEQKELKAHQNYDQLRKKQEESEEEANKVRGSAKEAKAKKSAEDATKKAEKADTEYSNAVKELQGMQQKFYHDEMPKILDDLQKLEEDRVDKMKDWFQQTVKLQDTVPPAIQQAVSNMRSAVDSINRTNDILGFINSNTSNTPKPAEVTYVPYNSGGGGGDTSSYSHGTVRMAPSGGSSPALNTSTTNLFSSAQSSPATQSPQIQSQRATVAPTKAAVDTRATVRALYKYEATEETELSFNPNDRIVVLQKDDSGWWQGELNGAVGMFPSNFVEDGVDGGAGGGATPAAAASPAAADTNPFASNADAGVSRCKVLYDYAADSDSELTIKEGDTLTIESEEEGWYFGKDTKGNSGRFPSNYVQVM